MKKSCFHGQHGFLVLGFLAMFSGMAFVRQGQHGEPLYISRGMSALGQAVVHAEIPWWTGYLLLIFGVVLTLSSIGAVFRNSMSGRQASGQCGHFEKNDLYCVILYVFVGLVAACVVLHI